MKKIAVFSIKICTFMSFKVLLSSCLWPAQISSYSFPKVQNSAARYRAALPQNIQPRIMASSTNLNAGICRPVWLYWCKFLILYEWAVSFFPSVWIIASQWFFMSDKIHNFVLSFSWCLMTTQNHSATPPQAITTHLNF